MPGWILSASLQEFNNQRFHYLEFTGDKTLNLPAEVAKVPNSPLKI